MEEYGMFTFNRVRFTMLVIAGVGVCMWLGVAAQEPSQIYGVGRPATKAEIDNWNIDVSPNGEGLPAGDGTAKRALASLPRNALPAMEQPAQKVRWMALCDDPL
jgi:hypothetical protein